MELSSTRGPGVVNGLFSTGLQINDIAIMMDNQDQHLAILNETFPQSDLAVREGSGQYQDWMQPIGSIDDINISPTLGTTSKFSRMPPKYEPTARASMPIQSGTHHTQLLSRSHVSHPLPYPNAPAPMAAALLQRQAVTGSKQDVNRDSVQSTSSYNSIETDMSINTKHSSITTVDSQSSRSSRKLPPQKTMSSSVSSVSKKTHRRSSSLGGGSNPPSEIPCTYPGCTSTFTREPDRIRHESSIHKTEVGYTCLLHTCAVSCPDDCTDKHHNSPYQNARPDKMKEHLEKAHGWKLKQSDIPKSFLKSYHRQRRGWICGCGTSVGSWHDNEDRIAAHYVSCTARLQASFRRMSMEEPGEEGYRKGGSPATDKPLPRIYSQEDEDWFKGVLHYWSQKPT